MADVVNQWNFDPAEILGSPRKVKGKFHTPIEDKDNEFIEPTAIQNAVPDFMHLPILHDFHKERTVGIVESVVELSDGTFDFVGRIKATPDCDDVWQKIESGNYDQVSIYGKRTAGSSSCNVQPGQRTATCRTTGVRLDSISVCDENARNEGTSLMVAKAGGKVVFTVNDELIKAETTNSSLMHTVTDKPKCGCKRKGDVMNDVKKGPNNFGQPKKDLDSRGRAFAPKKEPEAPRVRSDSERTSGIRPANDSPNFGKGGEESIEEKLDALEQVIAGLVQKDEEDKARRFPDARRKDNAHDDGGIPSPLKRVYESTRAPKGSEEREEEDAYIDEVVGEQKGPQNGSEPEELDPEAEREYGAPSAGEGRETEVDVNEVPDEEIEQWAARKIASKGITASKTEEKANPEWAKQKHSSEEPLGTAEASREEIARKPKDPVRSDTVTSDLAPAHPKPKVIPQSGSINRSLRENHEQGSRNLSDDEARRSTGKPGDLPSLPRRHRAFREVEEEKAGRYDHTPGQARVAAGERGPQKEPFVREQEGKPVPEAVASDKKFERTPVDRTTLGDSQKVYKPRKPRAPKTKKEDEPVRGEYGHTEPDSDKGVEEEEEKAGDFEQGEDEGSDIEARLDRLIEVVAQLVSSDEEVHQDVTPKNEEEKAISKGTETMEDKDVDLLVKAKVDAKVDEITKAQTVQIDELKKANADLLARIEKMEGQTIEKSGVAVILKEGDEKLGTVVELSNAGAVSKSIRKAKTKNGA